MPELHRWSTPKKPLNYFAPQYDISVWQDDVSEQLTDDLLNIVLEKEKEGVFDNHQWEHYNVFSWNYKVIDTFKELIKASYHDFCKQLDITPQENVSIRGWVYPQKYPMNIGRHTHAMHENSFLSGSLYLTTHLTCTDYDIPYVGEVGFQTKKGKMTLFPSCLPHKVNGIRDFDPDRYVIAWDMITETGMNFFRLKGSENDPLNLVVDL